MLLSVLAHASLNAGWGFVALTLQTSIIVFVCGSPDDQQIEAA